MALLRTRQLSIGYAPRGARPTTILAELSTKIEAGELICVLGPNGAGKSTLLRTLAGMQPALAGRVEVLGRPVNSLRPRELARHVGVVLPERIRAGMLSAAALVALGRYPHTDWLGRLRPEDGAKIRRALRAVGVEHLASRGVDSLSDGERQKVMIARALAQEPTVMILDEPTAFLDLPGRVEIMALLLRLARGEDDSDAKDAGRAVLLSTHDLDLALHGADRVWLLDGAGGMAAGAPEDLVLGGEVRAAFERDSVRYDPRSGSFRIAARPTATVWLRGTGLADRWTRSALERRGFEVLRDPDDTELAKCGIEVENAEHGTGYQWLLSHRGETTRHDSIGALLAALSDSGTFPESHGECANNL